MITGLRGLRRRRAERETPQGFMPEQVGARMFWTISAGQEEHVPQLSPTRRAGVVGLMALLLMAAPFAWAATALADSGPQATMFASGPGKGGSGGDDDDDDDTGNSGPGGGGPDTATGNSESGDGNSGPGGGPHTDDATDNDGVQTVTTTSGDADVTTREATDSAAIRGPNVTTRGGPQDATAATTTSNQAGTTNTDTTTGPNAIETTVSGTGTTTSQNAGTTATATETRGATTADNTAATTTSNNPDTTGTATTTQ